MTPAPDQLNANTVKSRTINLRRRQGHRNKRVQIICKYEDKQKWLGSGVTQWPNRKAEATLNSYI